ncbi:hypothetical protein GCK32_013014 [Trichostrongylus colubriformis]|uniref:Uncharacterized protein n=1 Tax=Trichostrongylus colubriformis TaxID=6319 RepID=A0AAN8IH12_TRICO
MSSVRSRRGNFFMTATGVIIGKLLICFIGTMSLMDHIAVLAPLRPGHRRSLPTLEGDLVYFPALMVDVYSRFKDFPSLLFDHAEFTLLYHFVTSFAAFFMILAMVRKHKLATFWQRVNFIAAYSILGIFYSLVMSLELLHTFTRSHRSLILGCSLYFYMAATICIFTFAYGIVEYHKDIRETFRSKNRRFQAIRERCLSGLYFLIIPLLLTLQVNDLIRIYFLEHEKISSWLNQKRSNEVVQECFAIALACVPVFLPILFFLYLWCTKKGKALAISSDHPANRRQLRERKAAKKKANENKSEERVTIRKDLSKEEDKREREQSKQPKSKSAEMAKSTSISDEKVASRSAEKVASRSAEKVASRSAEKVSSRSAEKVGSRSAEKVSSRSAEKVASRSAEKKKGEKRRRSS